MPAPSAVTSGSAGPSAGAGLARAGAAGGRGGGPARRAAVVAAPPAVVAAPAAVVAAAAVVVAPPDEMELLSLPQAAAVRPSAVTSESAIAMRRRLTHWFPPCFSWMGSGSGSAGGSTDGQGATTLGKGRRRVTETSYRRSRTARTLGGRVVRRSARTPHPRVGRTVLFPTIQFGIFFPIVFVGSWLLRPHRPQVEAVHARRQLLLLRLVGLALLPPAGRLSTVVNQVFAVGITRGADRTGASAAAASWRWPPTSASSATSSTTTSSSTRSTNGFDKLGIHVVAAAPARHRCRSASRSSRSRRSAT